MISINDFKEYQSIENRLEELKKSFEKKAQELIERKYQPNPEDDFYGAFVDKIYFDFDKCLIEIYYSLQWSYKIKDKTKVMKFKEFCDA